MDQEKEDVKPQEIKKTPKKSPKADKKKDEQKVEKKPKEVPKENENFLYIVRIGNRDLDGERNVRSALSDVKGIGMRLADVIIKKLGIEGKRRIGDLDEVTLDKVRTYLESKEYEGIPEWALNHRSEIVSGRSYNLISNDLDLQLQDDVNMMRKVRSYKGVRHETGHKVRGQRTRSNGRKGLAIGVIKKKEAPQQKA
ncbi:MAG: 30S ribosomal protein S13 [Candidatus Thermoplasmatota archaeon]|jgi:small subunit ribosomal protein S13|nr:30S ribosomal protein S13 [Candidatus Thermoplasmatota archaeon]